MDHIFHFMAQDAFFAAIKAIVTSWLIVEALKRLTRPFCRNKSVANSYVWFLAITIGGGLAYWLHSSLEETLNPTLFFAMFVGLLTPILHHLIAIQGLGILESLLQKRFGISVDIRAAVTGSRKYVRSRSSSTAPDAQDVPEE